MINDPHPFVIVLFRLLALPFIMALLALSFVRTYIVMVCRYIRYGGEAIVYDRQTRATIADILETFEKDKQ